jgi:hypothetical protein
MRLRRGSADGFRKLAERDGLRDILRLEIDELFRRHLEQFSRGVDDRRRALMVAPGLPPWPGLKRTPSLLPGAKRPLARRSVCI